MKDAERRAMARQTIAKATRLRRVKLRPANPPAKELTDRDRARLEAAVAKRTRRRAALLTIDGREFTVADLGTVVGTTLDGMYVVTAIEDGVITFTREPRKKRLPRKVARARK